MLETGHLLQIFNSLPTPCIIVCAVEPGFRIVDVNKGFLKNTNTTPALLQKGFFEAFPNHHNNAKTESTSTLKKSLLTVIQTKVPHQLPALPFEMGSGNTDWEDKYWSFENIPVLNHKGEVEFIAICATEAVSEKVNAQELNTGQAKKEDPEKTLQLSEQRFKSLVQDGSDLIGILDPQANYLYVSPTSTTVLGMEPSEFIGRNAFEFIHPDDVPAVNEQFAKLETEKRINIPPFRFKHKVGSWRWVETIVTNLLDDPAVNGIVANSRDVTNRIKAEEELKASEEKYKQLFHTSPIPKLIYDLETFRMLDVNQTAIDHYGYSREEFLNMYITDMKPADELPKLKKAYELLRHSSGVLHLGIFTHIKKDKTPLKVEVSGHRINFQGRDSVLVACNDVTERINALEQLKDSEKKLRTATQIAKLGYWRFNLQDQSLYWSDEVYEIWGIAKGAFKISSNFLLNTVHPDDLDAYNTAQQLAEAGEKNLDLEHRILLPDGSIKWVHQKGAFKKDVQGNAIVFEGTVQDITPQKVLSLSLIESNLRYQYVTKATFDAIWDLDLEKDELYWGDGFEILFGYNLKGGKGNVSSWYNHIHPEDRPGVLESVNRIFNDPLVTNWKQEYRYIKANGEVAHVIDKGLIIRHENGKAYRMVGAMQDITRQKEEELRLKLLESVITHTNDAVLITTAEGEDGTEPSIEYVNEAFTHLTGYTAAEVIGKSPKILQGPKSDRKELARLLQARKNGVSCEITTVNYKKNGEDFWVHISMSPVADANGNITHWIAIERDITQKKKEELLKVLQSEISQVFNQPIQLKKMLELSLEKITAFGDFILGEVWLVNADKKHINVAARFASNKNAQVFIDESSSYKSFEKGHGLAGKVWASKNVNHWRYSSDSKESFIREGAAKKAGLKTVYALPLINNDEVIGSLVLGHCKEEVTADYFVNLFENLSAHLGSEIKRKQLEQDLSNIFSFAPDVICIAGIDGYFKKINPAACDLLEYTEEELLTTPYIEFIHPNDREKTEATIDHLDDSGDTIYLENRYITKSGKVKWLSWTTNQSANHGLLFAVAKDITDKKNLEDLLDKAANMAQIGSWEVDLINQTTYWSPITKKIYEVDSNYVPHKDNGTNFYKAGYNRAVIIDVINNAIAHGKPWDEELQIITANGNEKWVRSIGSAEFVNGKCVRLYGSFQDIDTNKKAEIDIAIALEEKSTILESIGDAFFAVDKNWTVTYWNNQAAKLLGITKQQIIGNNLWQIFDDATTNSFYTYFHKAVEEYSVVEFETKLEKLKAWLDVSAYPTTHGLAVYFKDVTERVLVEDKITKAIIKTQDDERYEIGSELHDNICQILATSQICLDMLKTSLPPEGMQWFKKCDEYIALASREIRGLSHRLAPAFFDESTLEDAFRSLLNTFNINNKYDIKLHFDKAANEQSLHRDIKLNLYRVLQEQLRNISKYAHATAIDVDIRVKKNQLVMTIADNGVGFDITSTKRGIGLANIKRRIELFSGKKEIESSPGHGCKINIRIPITD